jgi:hypothetical protein
MADRVPSDHPSVETGRARLVRRGRLDRPRIELPAEWTDASSGPLPDTGTEAPAVRLVLDGRARHARIERGFDGAPRIDGAYDNARLAREKAGDDRLEEWRAGHGVGFDTPVLLDAVEPGFQYGLREPGERVVYEVIETPDEGLAAIARDLDG